MSTTARTNFPVQLAPNVVRVGAFELSAITESSGLTASPRYPGVYWTHNDGGTPFLFAINEQGDHLGAFEVQGAALIDWEAVTFDERGDIYLADTGTNGMIRTHSAVHRVAEPNVEQRSGAARVEHTWYVRFPGEREDCESLFVHNGFCYLISKYRVNGRVSMYRFPLSDDSTSILLERVAELEPEDDVSDAALSPDGLRLVILTADGVEVFFVNGDPTTAGSATRRRTDFQNSSMEGVAFSPRGILVTTERTMEVLLFDNPLLSGAPVFNRPLLARVAFVGDDITLSAAAVGFPAPFYEWRMNGRRIVGNLGSPSLTLTNLSLSDAGFYEVIASNAGGSAQTGAELTVIERAAQVFITEAMSSEGPNDLDTADWWELTNLDTRTIDLSGWRFNDSTGGLVDAFVIPAGTSIRPGESIIFVEELDTLEFKAWWGAGNLASDAQIITFSGSALSFRATGDSIRLWDAEATDNNDLVARVDFGEAEEGVSFGFNPETREFGEKSRVGVHGAFRAAVGIDVGSPGRVDNPGEIQLVPELVSGALMIKFNNEPGVDYILERSDDLRTWEAVQTNVATPIVVEPGTPSRFYRLRRN